MTTLTMLLPDEASLTLKVPSVALGEECRLVAEMKLFEIGRLSSGAAADIAGVPKPIFFSKLACCGVSAFYFREQDLAEDVNNA